MSITLSFNFPKQEPVKQISLDGYVKKKLEPIEKKLIPHKQQQIPHKQQQIPHKQQQTVSNQLENIIVQNLNDYVAPELKKIIKYKSNYNGIC